jgi:hypothetical protein
MAVSASIIGLQRARLPEPGTQRTYHPLDESVDWTASEAVRLLISTTTGIPFSFGLHPTLTYIAEGSVSYGHERRPDCCPGSRGMVAGGGVCGGGAGPGAPAAPALIAAARLELGSSGLYLAPDNLQRDGPARVLLGSYGSAKSIIEAPSPINYLAVRLKKGERWHYQPPAGHTILWVAVGAGVVTVPDEIRRGELVAFEPSNDPIELEAQSDAELVIGSAVRHDHDLVLGYYSVHASRASLEAGERRIDEIKVRLRNEGRRQR